jgi:outer membrane protein OmpA-like peptidoglycan-associated protein
MMIMLKQCLGILVIVTTASFANAQQQRDFDTMPDSETLRALLSDPDGLQNRNIYTPSGDSLIQRPGQGASTPVPSPTAATSSKPAKQRPAKTQRPKAGPCKVYGSASYFNVRIQFALNSARVNQRYRKGIERLADVLATDTSIKLQIDGHTDASGGDQINVPLSLERAKSIARILIDDHGIDAGRITFKGYASKRPCYPNSPFAAASRRVTFARAGS